MTNEEAITVLSVLKNNEGILENEQNVDALIMAISALERQIPKKPFKESLADRLCTVCGAYINFDALNDDIESAPLFCTICGQALDWSKEKPKEEDT